MLSIYNITIPIQIAAKSEIVYIVDVKPIKKFVDGKPLDELLGFSYVVSCPANKFETFSIKVEQQQPVITPEELEAKGGVVKAKIKGFQGKFYQNKNKDICFAAKATDVELIS